MKKTIELKVWPSEIEDLDKIIDRAKSKSGIPKAQIKSVELIKRSIDARQKRPFYIYRFEISTEAKIQEKLSNYQQVDQREEIIIVGAGPCGYFAALKLLELGIKPIVLERGKDVRKRRVDLKNIQQYGVVDPHSNYCFGEGGAGTYSDGKLYTRAKKRGDISEVLRLLVEHGANEAIQYESHPHIGSNKLPGIIQNIRETIEKHGGEVHFGSFVDSILVDENKFKGVRVSNGKEYLAKACILATGHSARDIYHLLAEAKISIERKAFALGVRIEHPQALVDEIQYKQKKREEGLPAASYRLACQINDRGIFSFCMCPGGLVIPAATAPGEIVVNGMSLSKRDSPYANSGMVVSVLDADLEKMDGDSVFRAMHFQQKVEQDIFKAGDGSQKAAAQKLTDFVEGKTSNALNETSYIPGLLSRPLHEILPPFIYKHLKLGILAFGKKMKGYLTEGANVIATESRTSSPIKIPRDSITLMHPEVEGLFPAGEGGGYAGGIMSAAMDGQRVAAAVDKYFT